MTERVVKAAEDDDAGKTEILVGGGGTSRTISHEADPFEINLNKVKELNGLSPAFRRKVTREMQKQFRGIDGAKSKKYEQEYLDGYNIFGAVMPPLNMYYLAKLYEVSPAHYAAVNAKVANIVGLGFDLVESPKALDKLSNASTKDGTDSVNKKIARVKQQVFDWIDSCNQEDDFVETLIKVWTDYESTGNGYIEVGRTNEGNIGYIGHISSPTMRIRRERDGYVQLIGNRAVFFRNFGDKKTPDQIGNDERPNEIIHLKKYAPSSNYYGVPDIVAATQAVAGNEFAARFNLDYFENKAVPRYVIVIKGGNLSSTAERNLLEFFQTGLKGKNHRTLYVPLPAEEDGKKVSFEMKPVEAGTQDSSFVNYRNGNNDDILMAEAVPVSKVGGMGNGEQLAAAVSMDKTFKESVCRPRQDILEKKLNRIIKEVTDILVLKLNELTLTDEDTMSQMDQRYVQSQVYTPNDIRRRKGMTPLDGGDKVVELKPQQAADKKNQAQGTDQRAQDRSAKAPDKQGGARNPKGSGRQTG